MQFIQDLAIALIKPNPRNARTHPARQIEQIARSIEAFGFKNPVLIDENHLLIAGHGRFQAAKSLGMTSVPAIIVYDLDDAKKRGLALADNKLSEGAGWDMEILAIELQHLCECDLEVETTGFSTGEIDILVEGRGSPKATDIADNLLPSVTNGPAVSQSGDLWSLGAHRLMCGDARERLHYKQLLQDQKAQLVISDPPYNVKINGHVSGRGKHRHREFVMASGEMSKGRFTRFLADSIDEMIEFSRNGAISFLFIDWRHLPEMLEAALPRYHEWKNLLVWNKSCAGQGSFYRSQHELILAFKSGTAPHINNFGLGASGRYRTNVLDYPSVRSSDTGPADLDSHPTAKPLSLIADLIRDCSRRKGIVLDPFCGSGTIILAAERTGRVARAMELDPRYVDLTIRRWQDMTKKAALHVATGLPFDDCQRRSKRAEQSGPVTSRA